MGIFANVYRTGQFHASGVFLPEDATMNGWSKHAHQVLVVNAGGPFEPERYPEYPHVVLVQHPTLKGAIHAKLQQHVDERRQTMMGGNYLASSDSRFWELCEALGASRFHGAVSIHDRIE